MYVIVVHIIRPKYAQKRVLAYQVNDQQSMFVNIRQNNASISFVLVLSDSTFDPESIHISLVPIGQSDQKL